MPRHAAPLYRRIVADAWHIAWGHKHLWIFGFFAATIGFGGATETIVSSSDRVYAMLPGMMYGWQTDQAVPGMATLRALVAATGGSGVALLVFMFLMTAFAVAFAWMVYVSVGALLGAIRKIERGGDPDFAAGVKIGMARFWPVIGVNFWTSLFVFVCFALTASSLDTFVASGLVWRGLFYIGVFATFAVLSMAASIAAVFASCEAVIRKHGVRDSLYGAADVIAENWLVVIETGVVLFFSSLAIGLATVAGAAVLSVPFIFLIFLATLAHSVAAATAVSLAGAALMVIIIALAGSLVTTFQAAAWTLLWSEFEGGRPVAKLHRLARKHFPFLV